jgi:hypothetical protein
MYLPYSLLEPPSGGFFCPQPARASRLTLLNGK